MLRYEFAYNKTAKGVIVYPQSRGTRPNYHVIGSFEVKNPRADFNEYADKLQKQLSLAMQRVGELDLDGWQIKVTPYDGADFIAKDANPDAVDGRPPMEDQVPVGADKTVAQAAYEEQQGGGSNQHRPSTLDPVPGTEQAPERLDTKPPAPSKKDDKPTDKKKDDDTPNSDKK